MRSFFAPLTVSAALVVTVVAGAHATTLTVPSGDSTAASRIIGGQTSTRDLPWIVYLEGCGGALVAPQWVMTAAHCLEPDDDMPQEARIGSLNKKEGGTVVKVVKQIRHPKFSWANALEGQWDFGLVKLEKPVPNAPVAMATTPPAVGSEALMVGWGAENPDLNAAPFPKLLKELTSTIREPGACAGPSIPGKFSPDRELCLNNPGEKEGPCNGDSGSPLLSMKDGTYTLIGVTNRGGVTCAKTPSIYANVAHYQQWTADTIAHN